MNCIRITETHKKIKRRTPYWLTDDGRCAFFSESFCYHIWWQFNQCDDKKWREKNPQNYTANDNITCLIIMCVQYPWSDAISDFYRSYSNWFYGRRRINNWVRGIKYTHFMIEVINCKPANSLKCMRSMSLLLSAQNTARTTSNAKKMTTKKLYNRLIATVHNITNSLSAKCIWIHVIMVLKTRTPHLIMAKWKEIGILDIRNKKDHIETIVLISYVW